jgi:hypothetical protein
MLADLFESNVDAVFGHDRGACPVNRTRLLVS